MRFHTALTRLTVIGALLVAGLVVPAAASERQHRDDRDDALERVVEALGGDVLTDATSLRLTATGTRWTLDEGPFPGSGAAPPAPTRRRSALTSPVIVNASTPS